MMNQSGRQTRRSAIACLCYLSSVT